MYMSPPRRNSLQLNTTMISAHNNSQVRQIGPSEATDIPSSYGNNSSDGYDGSTGPYNAYGSDYSFTQNYNRSYEDDVLGNESGNDNSNGVGVSNDVYNFDLEESIKRELNAILRERGCSEGLESSCDQEILQGADKV